MATFRRFLLPGLLLVALVGSNLWWLYQAIDLGVTQKYADQLRYERTHALGALQRTVPALTRDLSKEEVVERIRAELEVAPDEMWEKEGWVVVGWVHLRFDESGNLVEVGPGVEQLPSQ